MQLEEHWRGSTPHTHAWDRSILYVFRRSIQQARRFARRYPLIRGPDVWDLPHYSLSLVWMDDIPYLFPGSLTAASERGKVYKRGKVQTLRERHKRMRHGLVGFLEQYGSGIGEG